MDELNNLSSFLNSIDINKNYYRSNISVKNIRYRNKLAPDTKFLKEVNTSLNKLSEYNYNSIINDITKKFTEFFHLYPLIIETIINQSIMQSSYITYYVKLIIELHKYHKKEDIIYKELDNILVKINNNKPGNLSDDYSNLCSKNKYNDQLTGYCILISELESNNIINGLLKPCIRSLLEEATTSNKQEDVFKCINVLYNIFKLIPQEKHIYINELTQLKENIKFMKVKFKIMDILEDR